MTVNCLLFLAEREGFEPSVRLHAHTLSRRAPSTTQTSLHVLSGAAHGTVPVKSRQAGIAVIARNSDVRMIAHLRDL